MRQRNLELLGLKRNPVLSMLREVFEEEDGMIEIKFAQKKFRDNPETDKLYKLI